MKNQDVQQQIFDRFTALQNHSEYTIEGNVSGSWLDDGITVKVDFITTAGLNELMSEFKTVAIDSEGLILKDY